MADKKLSSEQDAEHDTSKEMQKARYDAALEFLKYFQDKMPLVNEKPHAGTVFYIAGCLSGTSLFRSINGDKEYVAGGIVISEEINQIGQNLIGMFAAYCKQDGVDVLSKPIVLDFIESDKPLMQLNQIQKEYQEEFYKIIRNHSLSYLDGARVGVIVSSVIFTFHCVNSKDIDPYVAAGIVARGIVEGSKTVPIPLEKHLN